MSCPPSLGRSRRERRRVRDSPQRADRHGSHRGHVRPTRRDAHPANAGRDRRDRGRPVSTSLLKKAKRYKKMGLRPLPLGRSLHPWVEWKKFRNREPTDDEIEEWFADSKTIGIGAITGQVGDLEILGIDVDHKGGKNGWEALEEKGIKRLKAPTVHTPTNDGAHAIFLHPDVHIPSFDLMPGVEIKADGAMLVLDAPGYEWDEDLNLEDTEVPPLPKKVLPLASRILGDDVTRASTFLGSGGTSVSSRSTRTTSRTTCTRRSWRRS